MVNSEGTIKTASAPLKEAGIPGSEWGGIQNLCLILRVIVFIWNLIATDWEPTHWNDLNYKNICYPL
jgi:hypothetical protein